MSSRDPARLAVHVALSSLVLVATACSDDVEVGGFGGGGGSPTTGPGGEAGAGPTTSTGTDGSGATTGSTGTGDGGAGAAGSTGQGGEGQGGEAGATSTGQGGQGGAGEGGAEPTVCGGLAEGGSPTCDDATWCDYPDDSFCGGDDSTGLCQPRPLLCTEDGPIACGCDGEAYTNACYAQLAGTDVSNDEPTCGTPCEAGLPCAAADEFCQYADDNCGFTDQQPGVCVKRPTAESCASFPDDFVPVCACDGQTYGNACEAAAAGADVWGGEDLCET